MGQKTILVLLSVPGGGKNKRILAELAPVLRDLCCL